MFGSAPPTRRPVLLILVFGAFLAIVGITAAGQSTIVSSNFDALALSTIVGGDARAVEQFASTELRTDDIASGAPDDPARARELEAKLAAFAAREGIVRIELYRADGTRIAASGPFEVDVAPPSADPRSEAAIVPGAAAGAAVPGLGPTTILRERLPITDPGGTVLAVSTVFRDAAPILAHLDAIRWQVVLVTMSAAAVACVLLFFIFRSAQRRLTRQTHELVEATRTDALTGTLNHGGIVADLAQRIETGKDIGATVGIALVDLDNFTLLNDHHGHAVGDDALLTVLDLLETVAPAGVTIGRYGPDEFLLVVGADGIHELEPAMQTLRSGLVDHSLDVGVEDRLPITVSAGIAAYPNDASSVTDLLATVAAALGSARASGGDAIRVAGAEPEQAPGASSFDVLQGLVFAVDTKDRYTKRHSEDVARYAVFLAQRLGLDEATIGTIRIAGLLHDVGKIGIPDAVLRKPGRLTAEEQEIVKQHVVLGDMIVRDLPDIESVRMGIRHHHERWDGRGYVDRLEGETIPQIARILAVGDSFSAMTTSRPYRKALGLREAITRLVDASGTQLDEDLVTAFVHGLETAADPPLPGDEASFRLWTPSAVA